MASSNPYSNRWPRIYRSPFGLPNKWHQSKDWGTLRREQQLEFIQRQLKRDNQEQIGSCMRKISKECKSMLKNKMKEVIQHNTTLNQPTSNNRFKNYKCFQCKQLGHIVKSCPMDYKVENTDAKKETKRRMEGIKAIKPTVLITYLETIHFSTTCMIKDTDLTGWDEIWLRRMQNQYLQEYFESITKEGEGLEQDTIKIKRNLYSTKVQSFYDFVAFLNLVKTDDVSLPGTIPPVISGVEIHLFDLYKLIENLGGYLSVHFSQEFDMVGEIMGLSKGNGEEIKRCYINYLEILISHFKTARAPRQGHNDALLEPAQRAEKDRECLGSHQ
nr:ARID DNA-binding domain-containing protein [Tanacetum cinerariifolium]